MEKYIKNKIESEVDNDIANSIKKKGSRTADEDNCLKNYMVTLKPYESRLIFAARFDMVHSRKNHTVCKELYNADMKCLFCNEHRDRTRHIFRCKVINQNNQCAKYRHIFSNDRKKLKKAASVLYKWESAMKEKKLECTKKIK